MASSAFDYTKTRNTADRLITKFGQAVALRRNVATGTDFDPTLTPTDYATTGVKVEFTFKQLQSSDVLATDERWLIAAGPLTTLGIVDIKPPDMIVAGGVTRTVVKADTVSPAGVAVVYDCQLRK